MNEEQPLITWDLTQRMMDEAKHLFENWDGVDNRHIKDDFDEKPADDDEIFHYLCSDSIFSDEERRERTASSVLTETAK